MQIEKLLEGVTILQILHNKGRMEIHSLEIDSRRNAPKSMFFCLTGGNFDGHIFAEEAIKNGANSLVVERELPLEIPQIVVLDSRETLGLISANFYGNPTDKLSVIGITGTNGKTTTAHMLRGIFSEEGKNVGIIGTLGISYTGVEIPSDLTTPDPISLQETFSKMLAAGVEYVVMEVSAHALYYKKTAGVRFCACIFTNFTQDHLDFFTTMENYQRAKLSLFLKNVCPIALLNGDDETGRKIGKIRQEGGERTVFYGLNTPADAFAIVTEEGLYASECIVNINDKLCRITLSLGGKHNVYNALAAATCAVELGASMNSVARGLTRLRGVKGRLQRIASQCGADVFLDFAHTPDGLENSLKALKLHCKGRLICLFGCGGNRDRSKRALMGETAARWSDFCILTSDNPRYEDPLDILSEIERGYRRFSSRYVIVPDRAKAIEYALGFLHEKDVLLIAGKGGERYQEIMGIKYPFDEQDMVSKFLREGKRPL